MAARRLRSVTTQQQQIVIGVITSFESPLQLTSHAVHALQNLIDSSPPSHVSHPIAIEMIHSDKLHQLPGLLTTDRFHAAIITNTTPVDDNFLRTTHIPFPVVLVNRAIDGYDSVFENPTAAEAAAAILINLK